MFKRVFSRTSAPRPVPAPSLSYLESRSGLLIMTSTEAGMPHLEHPGQVWGVLIETGMEESMALLAAFLDGSNGMYFGVGEGAFNGSAIPKAVNAARDLVAASGAFADRLGRAIDFPLPLVGEVRFVFLTGFGLLVSPVVAHSDLLKGQHELTPIFNKAQLLLAHLRKDYLR